MQSGKHQLNEIIKLLDSFPCKYSTQQIMADIFEASAIAISNAVDFKKREEREKRYTEIMKQYTLEESKIFETVFTKLFELLSGMSNKYGFGDYLGELYMMGDAGSYKAGQFFTPYSVSKITAIGAISKATVAQKIADKEILTISEPACGAGGMILAALDVLWNDHHFNYTENCFVECSDIDKRCVHMCYLQLSLAGVPAVIRQANTLTMEQWDEWHTPALCMQWLKFRRLVNVTSRLSK